MPNSYDSILDEEEKRIGADVRAPGDTSPYDAVLDRESERGFARLNASIAEAVKASPDQAAKEQSAANALGVTPQVVQAEPDRALQMQRARQLFDLAKDSPILMRQLADPSFARIAHDDAENLKSVEQAIGTSRGLGSLARMGRAMAAGLTFDISSGGAGLLELGAKLFAPLLEPLAGTILPENPLARAGAGWEKLRKGQAKAAEELAGPASTDFVEEGVRSGFRSMGQMAPALAATIATGNPQFALSSAGALAGSQAASRALDAGKSPIAALGYGAADATAEIVTEMIPLGKLVRDLKAGAPFLKVLANQAIREVPTELAATAWQNLNEWLTLHPEKTVGDFIDELGPAEAQTVIATLTMTVLTAGFGHTVNRMAGNTARAAQAEQSKSALEDLNRLAEASRVRERAPESFQQFVEEAAKDTPLEAVWVDARELSNVLQQSPVENMPPSVQEQLQEAAATGGDIRIPIGEYAATIAATDAGKALLPFLKTDPDAMSQAEAQTFFQEHEKTFKAEAEKTIGAAEQSDQAREQAQQIQQHFEEKLAQANRFTKDVNKAYASILSNFYTANAPKLGITPAEMLQRYQLNIGAQSVAGGRTMEQARAKHIATPEFKKWFGDSKVVDENGKPLVVYHGTGANFLRFRVNKQLGAHFGTAEQASQIAAVHDSASMVPVYLSIRNPLRLEDKGDFTAEKVVPQLVDLGLVPKKRAWEYPSTNAAIVKIIKAAGYDGVVYLNRREGVHDPFGPDGVDGDTLDAMSDGAVLERFPTAHDSYIAFLPEQIKSAIGNRGTFDPNDSNILMQGPAPAALDDFKPGNVQGILDKSDWAILTAENPGAKQLPPEENAARMEELKAQLATRGALYTAVRGKYGSEENSLLITNISANDALALGKKFGQESVLTREGLVYADGTVNPATGVEEFSQAPEDFFSIVPATGAKFAVQIDFDKRVPLAALGFSARPRQPDAVSVVGVHYGREKVGVLEGSRSGTGIRGAEQLRVAQSRDARVKRRVYFYVRANDMLPMPEQGLGQHVYTQRLDNIAPQEKVLEIAKQVRERNDGQLEAGQFEAGIIDAGYDGYQNRGMVVVLDADVPAQYLGTTSDLRAKIAKLRVFAQPAFHGSIHNFDRFDLSKIGTGEGAQSYGWGLYFAENPETAEYYRRELAGDPEIRNFKVGARSIIRNGEYLDYAPRNDSAFENVWARLAEDLLVNEHALRAAASTGNLQEYVLEQAHQLIDYYETDWPEGVQAAKDLYKILQRPGSVKFETDFAPGAVYQVHINDAAVERFLDWDKPLSEQNPKVQQVISEWLIANQRLIEERNATNSLRHGGREDNYKMAFKNGATGADVYRTVANTLGSDKAASEALLSKGVFGVRYLDSGSRVKGKEKPTHNLVVFDDSIVEITHKNGKPVTAKERAEFLQSAQGGNRGQISFPDDITASPSTITLLQHADLSTFLHETGHFFLEVMSSIASRPNAPAEIASDFETVLKWAGVKDSAQWAAMTLEQKRQYHEKFARGFEAYLFEGKSPSIEMQSVFSRFRAWLISVYQSLTSLNVTLTDEVRQVFDRLIATDEQIKAAETARAYAPLFDSRPKGMTTAEWEEYQKLDPEATDEATRQLDARSMRDMAYSRNARAAVLKKLQADAEAKRKATEAEVTAEVKKQPVYAALNWLKTGESPDGRTIHAEHKLNIAGLEELYAGEGDRYALLDWSPLQRYASNDGLHPNLVAELFGFSSGDALVRNILDAEPMESVIEGLTDRRMLERYGDLATPAALERAADQAVHNNVRTRFVATELKALSQATGSPKLLTKAAKQFADEIIARRKVREIRPAQYDAAEARAARAAEKALKGGKLIEAATQKRNQLVNMYASRAANAALDYVEKRLGYLKKFDNESTRKNLDPEYLDQIDQLLEKFDLRVSVTQGQIADRERLRESLEQWAEKQREQGFEPEISKELQLAARQHYSTLTLEQFRGLVDQVKNIEHLARLTKRLLTEQSDRLLQERVTEAVASIAANAKKTIAPELSSDRAPLTPLKRVFKAYAAEHRVFSSLLREFDGIKDNGVMWNLLAKPMNERGAEEAERNRVMDDKLAKILKPIVAGERLGKKTEVRAVGRSFTREERIGIALNMGNEVNRERVLDGERWSPSQLGAVLDTLTKEEWQFVQNVWDLLEEMRPDMAAKQRRVTGIEPEWVEPEQVVTKHGVFRGGYYPIVPDPLRSSRSEADSAAAVQRQIEHGLYVRATTRRGHLQERGGPTGRPLRYDLGVITRHIRQVNHDLAWHEWLIDANRLLKADGRIDQELRLHYGPEKLAQLKATLRDIAIGGIPAVEGMERIAAHLRKGSTIAYLGWNVMTSIAQPLGLTQSVVRVGPKWIAKGMLHWVGDAARFQNAANEMRAKSKYMRERPNVLQRETAEILGHLNGRPSLIEHTFFWPIQKMQLVADIPTWFGAYEKAMAQDGMTEAQAVALADQAVIDSQGSGGIQDLAAVLRGNEFKKLFTNFASYFNRTYNLAVEQTKATNFKHPVEVAGLAMDYVLLFMLPALVGTLIRAALKGSDDEDKLLRQLIADQINYVLGSMIGLRELGTAANAITGGNIGYGGPAGVRIFAEASELSKQIAQGEPDRAAFKAAANTAGILFHFPSAQLEKSIEGALAIADGRTDNPGALIVGAAGR